MIFAKAEQLATKDDPRKDLGENGDDEGDVDIDGARVELREDLARQENTLSALEALDDGSWER